LGGYDKVKTKLKKEDQNILESITEKKKRKKHAPKKSL